MTLYRHIVILACLIFMIACRNDTPKPTSTPKEVKNVSVPPFNSDNAYALIEKQLSFGARVPGTPAHTACKEWIISELEAAGVQVTTQDFKADFQNQKDVLATNVIGQINPSHPKRILLGAHWDTRIIADNDPDESKRSTPIPGADDGGSGVAILLEIAKVIAQNPIEMGVDLVFFDAEDQGNPKENIPNGSTYCLGSQYWAKNLIPKNYKPEYGILLDMVGASNASFYKEGFSRAYAGTHVDKIWTLAKRMGYSDFFIDKKTPSITDDHRFVNEIAKIPMLDIINMKPEQGRSFQKCWHTQCDDISTIDKRTLRVVGQVVTAVLYKESGNNL